MEPITIEQLYQNYEILSDAKDKILEHEKEYEQILAAVRGDDKQKRLASQFIGKFFRFFPHLMDVAIDAQLDLCEDADLQIRRQAIKDLPQLCKDSKEHTSKIADILAQLLVVQDVTELQQVHMSLVAVAKLNAKETLSGLFIQILTGDELTRERCLKFLSTKFRNLGPEIITADVEEHMISEIKKILHDVTADEFHTCMTILGTTKLGTSVTGHAELVTLAVEQADLDTSIEADTNEDEVVERYIQCATHALPYFSSQVESTKFIKFMTEKIMQPTIWNLIGVTEQQDQMQLRLLKVFAEMCSFCGALEKPAESVEVVFNVLQEFMPLPPLDAETIDENPSFQFSHAECLLYALHTIGKQAPAFFAFADEPAKLKEFRSRLQYLARGTQGYIKKLQEAVRGKTQEELSTNENKIKVTALLTTSNISTLIRDLFHSPPTFKSIVHLSWVPKKQALKNAAAVQKDKAGNKRHAPITFTGRNNGGGANNGAGGGDAAAATKRSKNTTGSDQRVYSPPSGKYSAKVANYSSNGGGGGNAGNGTGGNNNRNRNQARRSGGSATGGGNNNNNSNNNKTGNNRRRR